MIDHSQECNIKLISILCMRLDFPPERDHEQKIITLLWNNKEEGADFFFFLVIIC